MAGQPLAALSAQAREAFLRQRVAEIAVEQQAAPDPLWQPAQRDCAGLVRFAYRQAFRALDPARAGQTLFRDARGGPADFADAQTLLRGSFAPLGRGEPARRALRSGDLLAFRQEGGAGEPDFHLMIVAVPPGAGPSAALVVYHPGAPGAAVRTGSLRALETDAPLEWRPSPQNAAFLGFYRFEEWTRDP